MDRNKVFIPSTNKLTESLQDKYPGTPAIKVRRILKAVFDNAINMAIDTGSTIAMDNKRRLSISICQKEGYNHIPIDKRGSRAVSYRHLGIELEVGFAGSMTRKSLYRFVIDRKYKKKLQEKVDNPEYIDRAL